MNSLSISGKTILITGAYGLIGKTLALGFLDQGAKVVLADLATGLRSALEEELAAKYPQGEYLFVQLDITDEASAQAAVEATVARFGRLDVLINNAAIDAKFDKSGMGQVNQSRFENYPIHLLRKSVEVNLTGTVIMTQAACRQMLAQGAGNIINVASTYSMVAPNQQLYDFGQGIESYKPIDYIASKSFIPNFTRYIATFYAQEGIRCNALVPHGIYNDHPQPFLDNWARLSPIGRMCNREELVGPFTFLASDASSYMTGSVLTVDGGWTAW
jgi:NAD(P)-dependent dehydrogenase (short-subunit alcohol dehydrogenase family)